MVRNDSDQDYGTVIDAGHSADHMRVRGEPSMPYRLTDDTDRHPARSAAVIGNEESA